MGKDADVKDKSTRYSFKYGNSDVTVTGPIYHIDGIVPQAYDVANPTVSEGGVTFNGFYYATPMLPSQAPSTTSTASCLKLMMWLIQP